MLFLSPPFTSNVTAPCFLPFPVIFSFIKDAGLLLLCSVPSLSSGNDHNLLFYSLPALYTGHNLHCTYIKFTKARGGEYKVLQTIHLTKYD